MKNSEKQTLINLWNENVHSVSDKSSTPQESELIGYLSRHEKDISKKLDKEGLDSLKKYKDCYDELLSLYCEDAFVRGFSLASKILSEALS